MANFEKLLAASINDITRSLKDRYSDEVTKLTLDHYDSKEYLSMWKDIKALQEEILNLEKERRQMEDAQSKLIPELSFEWKEWLEANWYGYWNYWTKEPKYKAIRELHTEDVYNNIKQFDRLSYKFSNAMALWVWTKDKHKILMSFYTLDWKSLWIDIPPEMDFSNVDIKDWKIISDTSRLLN